MIINNIRQLGVLWVIMLLCIRCIRVLQGRRGQMMEEMVQLLLGGRTEQSRCVVVNYVLSTNQ